MTEIRVSAVTAYLLDAGWSRSDQTWHGGAIWSRGSEEVLVPPRDGMSDNASRLRELLLALESFEERPAGEIARDIVHPLLDCASYRAPDTAAPEGFVSLPSGLGALQGMRDMLRAAASTVLESPHFRSGADHAASELLGGIHLGTTPSRQFALTLLVPLSERPAREQTPLGRRVLEQMHVATSAVHQAVRDADPAAFEAMAGGVSAEFCTALSSLAGAELQQPFELGFRWARRVPSALPNRTLEFPPGAGVLIQEGSLRRSAGDAVAAAVMDHSGPTTISGRIESLHDNDGGSDRWRVKVRGEIRSEGRNSQRRSIWIRLNSQEQYDVALAAHRNHQEVQVSGTWTEASRGVRLLADPDGLTPEQQP